MKTIILLLGNSGKVILIVVFLCNMTLYIKVNMLWTLIIFCRKKKIENNCLCFQLTMSASNESNLAVDNESAAEVACDVIINYQNEARIMVETMELMNDGWRPFCFKKRECSGERQSQRL